MKKNAAKKASRRKDSVKITYPVVSYYREISGGNLTLGIGIVVAGIAICDEHDKSVGKPKDSLPAKVTPSTKKPLLLPSKINSSK